MFGRKLESRSLMIVKRTVKVWGTSHEISVQRRSEALWVATGEYLGRWIEARGGSESDALNNWIRAARNRIG